MGRITNVPGEDWWCENCPANKNESCGSWRSDSDIFPSCKKFHARHAGWKKGVPSSKPTRPSNPFQLAVDVVLAAAWAAEKTSVIETQKIRNQIRMK